jgi:DNA-directed RNA polymerase specialized sigma24 family protein
MTPPRAPDREQTFRSLYAAVYPDLLRFAQRRAHPDHAEDVVADAFLVVWRRLDELPRLAEDARAWVFGIARNLLLNDQRTAQRQQALGVRLAGDRSSAAVQATPTWSSAAWTWPVPGAGCPTGTRRCWRWPSSRTSPHPRLPPCSGSLRSPSGCG